MRYRSEVRTVRLNENPVRRNPPNNFDQILRAGKRSDAGKRDHEPELERAFRQGRTGREAMKDAAARRKTSQQVFGVRIGVARVDDHRQVQVRGDLQLPLEYGA